MKLFRILGRSIRDAFKSVFRNFNLSLASIVCITVTLIIVGITLLISYNVNSITGQLESELEIVVFISNDADDFDTKNVETQIKSIKNTKTVTYKTKAEIKNEMMEGNETFELIMKDWDDTESPLQNTYLVRVQDASKISETANQIKKLKNVTLVRYGENMVEQLLAIFDMIKKACLYSVIALVLVTAFLIANTIKLTIYSRKREISIMRLVGASNVSIKIPFVTEGIFLGILGSIIPVILIFIGYKKIYTLLGGKLFTEILNLAKPGLMIYQICAILLILGILVGMLGSLFSVKKHLKV